MSNLVSARLLNGVTATGDGPTLDHLGAPMVPSAVQVEISGAPTRVVVSIKGLLDGSTFDTLLTLDTDEGYVSGEIVAMSWPVGLRHVKASLDTFTGGGSGASVSCYFVARG